MQRRSSRDPEQLGPRLASWLTTKLGDEAVPQVSEISGTSTNGMSSDTLIFYAHWMEGSHRRNEHLVARIAPNDDDAPVFPSYDLAKQFKTISLVAELTDVPVPTMYWYEDDTDVFGMPFFVMSCAGGEPPPDVMPYNFGDNWLFNAESSDQRLVQDATVEVLATLHAIDDAQERFDFLELSDPGDTALQRHVAHTRAWYDFARADGGVSPLIERGFEWLEAHMPAGGSTVLSWGDARIGNVLYQNYRPSAVLDWEMAALGPRELDIGWLVHAHEVFEYLATSMGMPGMPHFMRSDDVCGTYESLTGYRPANLDFYRTYAAVQWAIVFLRTGYRGVHFGEREMPADPEELLHNRGLLEAMIG